MEFTNRLCWVSGALLALGACTAPPLSPDDGGVDSALTDSTVADVRRGNDGGACVDMDNDGHPSAACGGDDCDDNNPRRNPGIRELCDNLGVDEDCDPCTVGEVLAGGVGGDGDRDEDGFPSGACFNHFVGARPMCAPLVAGDAGSFERFTVSDTEVRGRDCDDTTRTRNPAVSERCDERLVDENCNGTVNEGCECPTVADPAISRRCAGAVGECSRGTQDCVDGRWSMCSIAAADEVCNGRDDNCNGMTDEGLRTSCFRDVDGDGLAAAGATATDECGVMDPGGTLTCPAGFTATPPTAARDTDCDDSVATGLRRSPRLMEVPCNAVDDDCNAATTDSCPGGQACGAAGMCNCPAGQQFCGGRCQMAGSCTATNMMCSNSGVWQCNAGGTVTCSASTPVIRAEIPCNGTDENCNGSADDRTCPYGGQACSGTSCACSTAGETVCGNRCQPSGACVGYPAASYRGGYCQYNGTYTCNGATNTAECRGTLPSGPLTVYFDGNNPALSHQCGSNSVGTQWNVASPVNSPCYLVYGPYYGLPRGRYSVAFSFVTPVGGGTFSGVVDAYAGTSLASATVTSNLAGVIPMSAGVTFDVLSDCLNNIEFRVRVDNFRSTGGSFGGSFGVSRITLNR